jgi:hypothetical protein
MPTPETYGQMRARHNLVERIKEIPVPVVLQLASAGPVSPPGAGTAKKIARDLEAQLLSKPLANTFWSHGYTFLVMGDSRRAGQQMVSPLGDARLLRPAELARRGGDDGTTGGGDREESPEV